MNLATLTDCPAVSQFPQRVRFNPERERVSFDHVRIMRQRAPGRQGEIRPPYSTGPATKHANCFRGGTGIAYRGAVVWTQFYSNSAYREAWCPIRRSPDQ